MKGAYAVCEVITITRLITSVKTMIGSSHHFLRTRKKSQIILTFEIAAIASSFRDLKAYLAQAARESKPVVFATREVI